MASFTPITIDPATFDKSARLAVTRYSSGVCESQLRSFVAGIDTFAIFALDQSGKTAMRNAIAKVAGVTRDAVRTHIEVATTANGKTTYKRLRKDESAGKRETRKRDVRYFSSDAQDKGMALLHETTGVDWSLYPAVSSPNSGELVYCFTREAVVTPAA